MVDLFGVPQPEPRRSPKKAPVLPAPTPIVPLPGGARRPIGKVAAIWLARQWQPVVGSVVHFNAGSGYDLVARKRSLMNACFGYVLALNHLTGEALIHLPKPRMRRGADEYWVVPFSDLLPVAVVADFDEAAYKQAYPLRSCPLIVTWDCTAKTV